MSRLVSALRGPGFAQRLAAYDAAYQAGHEDSLKALAKNYLEVTVSNDNDHHLSTYDSEYEQDGYLDGLNHKYLPPFC